MNPSLLRKPTECGETLSSVHMRERDSPNCRENDDQMAQTVEEYEKILQQDTTAAAESSLGLSGAEAHHCKRDYQQNHTSGMTDTGLYYTFKSPLLPVNQSTALHV